MLNGLRHPPPPPPLSGGEICKRSLRDPKLLTMMENWTAQSPSTVGIRGLETQNTPSSSPPPTTAVSYDSLSSRFNTNAIPISTPTWKSSDFNRDVRVYVRTYVCMYVRMYVCTYVRMYVCMYVRTYVCMYYYYYYYYY